MLNFKISDSEISMLKRYRDRMKDGRNKTKFVALILLAIGVCIEDVCLAVGCSSKTINNWIEVYSNEGIDALSTFNRDHDGSLGFS
jgi:hypothetical protein